MTTKEFFTACQLHDWFCAYSDDYSVAKAGQNNLAHLKATAATSPELTEIFDAWRNWYMEAVNGVGTRPAPQDFNLTDKE